MIDIIIPVYNAHETLPLTLMSISLQQVSIPYQVTIIDDCSDEDYQEILKPFQEQMKIQVFRFNVNSGFGVAREYGIQQTGGDFITFLDAGDLFYDSNSLETLYTSLEEDYDLVSSHEWKEEKQASIISDENLHGKLYRRQFLIDHNIHFTAARIYEDFHFHSFVLLSGARVYELNQNIYFCSQKENPTQEIHLDKIKTLLLNIHDLLEKVPLTYENTESVARFIYRQYQYFNQVYLSLEEEDQNKLEDLIIEYDPEHISFLGIKDNKKLQKEVYASYGKIVLFED